MWGELRGDVKDIEAVEGNGHCSHVAHQVRQKRVFNALVFARWYVVFSRLHNVL